MTDKPTTHAGIDIGATNIKYGLVSPDGEVLYKDRRSALVEKGAEPLLHLINNIAENLLYLAADEGYEVKYLGIGSPGAVDTETGQIVGSCPNIAGWQGTLLGQSLRDRLNLPVWVDNDANAMALAEARFGAAVGYRSALCVTLGTGVGGAIIIDGNIWRGATSSAGEIGQLFIHSGSSMNGHNSSLESLCNSKALIERARVRLESGLTPIFDKLLESNLDNLTVRKLFGAARKGDQIAIEAIQETAEYLGLGLAGAVNLLNPEIVVIGGGIADGGLGFVDAVTVEIRKHVIDSASEKLRVVRASLGNSAGFIGASLLGENF